MSERGLRGPTVVAVATALALGLPASGLSAAAGLQDDRLGEAAQAGASDEQIDTLLDQVKQAKPKFVRVNVFWGAVAPTRPANARRIDDPAYNWDQYDRIFTGLRQRGVVPMAVIWDYPEWASGKKAPPVRGQPASFNPNVPRKVGDYANFVYAFAERYDGTKANPDAPPSKLGRVNLIEAANEPNIKTFFRKGSGSNSNVYIAMHKAGYVQAHGANKGVVFILAGFGPNSKTASGNISARAWLARMAANGSLKLDGWAGHWYPPNGPKSPNPKGIFPRWQDSSKDMGGLKEFLNRRRGARNTANRSKPVYITEAGWTTQNSPFRKRTATTKQQATFISQMFGLGLVKKAPFAGIVQFNYYDDTDWPGGLRTAAGKNKPSYGSFTKNSRKGLTSFERKWIR